MGKTDRNPKRDRPTPPPAPVPSWLPGWMKLGILLLFLVGCAFGVLEVHSSNDTWIALAAGRQIMSEPHFPVNDTFSFPFYGKIWFNQNWLSHVYFWLLYDHLGPNAVIYGTYAAGVGMFVFVLLATWLRCGSGWMATLAAAGVAIASRDWLSARPATIQFFLVALLWLTLSALLSQGTRPRWWPIVVLFLTFGVWTHAHGSFVFGYLLVAIFLTCAAAASMISLFARWAGFAPQFRGSVVSWPQWLVVVAVALVTGLLGIVLSPYGLENYTHPLKVVESQVFRQIGEWLPPYVSMTTSFPPVWPRFWAALTVACSAPLLAALVWGLDPKRRSLVTATTAEPRPQPQYGAQMILFDLISVGLGLAMAMFARRFAPTFYILAVPALTALTVRLGRALSPWLYRLFVDVGICMTGPAVVLVAIFAYWHGQQELVGNFPANTDLDLLGRTTRLDLSPRMCMEFLQRNELRANVFTEWTLAGSFMFFVPTARVFIDGRSQQVYSEKHYLSYTWLMGFPDEDRARIGPFLAQQNTDVVILRRNRYASHLGAVLDADPNNWALIFATAQDIMFVRRRSPLLEEMGRRERAGELWWPGDVETETVRGNLLASLDPPELEQAVLHWRTAVATQPAAGLACYWRIVRTLALLGRVDEAVAFVQSEKTRLGGLLGNDELRARLLQELQRCDALLGRERNAPPPPGGS